jgi:hypothetical protein
VRNGHEWWSGNATHTTGVKVNLVPTDLNPNSANANRYSLVVDGQAKTGVWRKLKRNYPNGDIFVADYRGVVKESNEKGEHTLAEELANDRGMAVRQIYHERPAHIPAYDVIRTTYEEEGWTEGWVYYYGVRAVLTPHPFARRNPDDPCIRDGWTAGVVMAVSHTPSALTPKRALCVDPQDRGYGLQLPHASLIEYVEKGKVVKVMADRGNSEADYNFEREWRKGVTKASIRVKKSWVKTTTSVPKNERFYDGDPQYTMCDGGVLMSEISSKNITDTAMNPFGEGSIAKNRKPLADGLWYITDTPDAVPDFAVGKARQNFLFKKELMERVLHPDRVAKMVETYGIEWVDV